MGIQPVPARKVVVVADPSRESAGALQYALSHVVLEKDELILMHVENPNSWKNTFSFLRRIPSGSAPNAAEGFGIGDVDFLEAMKHACEVSQPKIRLRVERVQMESSNNKANSILSQCKLLGIDLLIVGQRRSISSVILGYKRSGGTAVKGFVDTADYLIENSKCTCVAVQKKGQNGGYLLNSKTMKNFWLLA